MSGAVKIFAYGSADFLVRFAQPSITLHIEKGCVVHVLDQTDEFGRILDDIRQEEGQIWVRELGLGLNRAFTRDHRVNDVGTYERMCGVHLSLGAKHSLYKKPQFTRSRAKYHVDVFVDTDCVHIDSAVVYQKDKWIL